MVSTAAGCSVGCAWGDYDNDGWLDLFVANLGPVRPGEFVTRGEESNSLYHNNGDGTFTRITTGSLVNDFGYSTGCAWADYDNDGFLDLVVANGWNNASQNEFLYRNNGNTNSWISFRLIGTVSNRSAIGAKVRVQAALNGSTFWQMRELSGGSNYSSQNDLRASFGLGDATTVELVRIEWPSGAVTELRDVPSKQFLTILEPPRLIGVTRTGGTAKVTLRGGMGFSYALEASTDLQTWLPLRTNTAAGLTLEFEDAEAAKHEHQFYRARAIGRQQWRSSWTWEARRTLRVCFAGITAERMKPTTVPCHGRLSLKKRIPISSRSLAKASFRRVAACRAFPGAPGIYE